MTEQQGAHFSKYQDSKSVHRLLLEDVPMKLECDRNVPWKYFPGSIDKLAVANAFEIKVSPTLPYVPYVGCALSPCSVRSLQRGVVCYVPG